MPHHLIAFPVYNAFFEIDEMSFKVADVTYMSKASLSKEIPYLNRESHFKENQIFATVTNTMYTKGTVPFVYMWHRNY